MTDRSINSVVCQGNQETTDATTTTDEGRALQVTTSFCICWHANSPTEQEIKTDANHAAHWKGQTTVGSIQMPGSVSLLFNWELQGHVKSQMQTRLKISRLGPACVDGYGRSWGAGCSFISLRCHRLKLRSKRTQWCPQGPLARAWLCFGHFRSNEGS